jgi:cold shock CspA family protein
MKGKITSYDKDGKCGFIEDEDGEQYFFQKDIEETDLEVGSKVKFQKSEMDKGSDAMNLELIED